MKKNNTIHKNCHNFDCNVRGRIILVAKLLNNLKCVSIGPSL